MLLFSNKDDFKGLTNVSQNTCEGVITGRETAVVSSICYFKFCSTCSFKLLFYIFFHVCFVELIDSFKSHMLTCMSFSSLNVCQHCSCTSVHILCTPANVVTSALAQVFSKTVIHGIESQHSFNLVAEQWLASNKPMRLLPRCGSLRRSKIS